MQKTGLSQKVILECRQKLMLMKEDVLNRIRSSHLEVTIQDKMSGDEIDQTVAQNIENQFTQNQNRLRLQVLEIENALARIQKGQFGVCEETQEYIEEQRLLALPYTRLSLEGAELREAISKKFAR